MEELKLYRVEVAQADWVDDEDLHRDDVDDLEEGTYHYWARSEEDALDVFHETVPIAMPENYEINCWMEGEDPQIEGFEAWAATLYFLSASEVRLPFVREGYPYILYARDEDDATDQLHDAIHAVVLDHYDVNLHKATKAEIDRSELPLWKLNMYRLKENGSLRLTSPWQDDSIQFPRLIAELEACGAFTESILEDLCESMDLEPVDVAELIDRAQYKWDHSKAQL